MKILILIDCQNDFISGSLGSKEAQEVIPNIIKKIKDFKGDAVITTHDTHFDNYLNTREGKNLPIEHCIYGTDGWKLEPSIDKALSEKTELPKYGVLKETFGEYLDLPMKIAKICPDNKEDLDIELIGFCTDICVISNALILKSYKWETSNITVDASCCSGSTPEAHKAALLVMKNCQINIINE